jgi:hypothetical protein
MAAVRSAPRNGQEARVALGLRLLALLIVALQLAAPLAQESWAWGVWPTTYLPPVWRWALGAAAVIVILTGDRVAGWLAAARRAWPLAWITGLSWPSFRLVMACLAVIPFYLFRIVHTRWGDAYILVHAIPHPVVRLTYNWQAPLDVFIHAKTWALGNRLFGWPDATPAYTLWSPIAGVAFLWILLGYARWVGRDRTERVLICGLIGTLGTMQLFFGYIENYVLVTVALLAYGWLALQALRGETPALWPAAALALAHGINPSTIFIAPSMLYVAWHAPIAWPGDAPRPAGTQPGWRTLWAIVVPNAVIGIGVLALMTMGGKGAGALLGDQAPGGADRTWFVPLWTTATRWEHYTMFSLGHLIDVVNEQLMTAPVAWSGMVLTAILGWQLLPTPDRGFRFLLIYAGLYLGFILTWNADFGGQRDWDLYSLAAIPAMLLFSYTLPRVLADRRRLAQAGWALVAAQGYHTIAWVYQNTRPWEWPK